jgi:hypothetical protein
VEPAEVRVRLATVSLFENPFIETTIPMPCSEALLRLPILDW